SLQLATILRHLDLDEILEVGQVDHPLMTRPRKPFQERVGEYAVTAISLVGALLVARGHEHGASGGSLHAPLRGVLRPMAGSDYPLRRTGIAGVEDPDRLLRLDIPKAVAASRRAEGLRRNAVIVEGRDIGRYEIIVPVDHLGVAGDEEQEHVGCLDLVAQ